MDHELPILRSLQSHNRTLVQSNANTCADVTHETIPEHTAATASGSQALLLESSGTSVNGASASKAPEHVTSSTIPLLDVGTSVRKLACLALTDSWRARNQESIEAELREARNKGLRSKGKEKKNPRKKVPWGVPKRLSSAGSPHEGSSNKHALSAELDMATIDEESPRQSPRQSPSTQRVDIPKRSSPTIIPRGTSPTVVPRGSPPRNSPRGSPLLRFIGRSPSTSSPHAAPEFMEEAAVAGDGTEYEPRFYTDDLLPIIGERNELKERVLQLEDQLEDMQRQV